MTVPFVPKAPEGMTYATSQWKTCPWSGRVDHAKTQDVEFFVVLIDEESNAPSQVRKNPSGRIWR